MFSTFLVPKQRDTTQETTDTAYPVLWIDAPRYLGKRYQESQIEMFKAQYRPRFSRPGRPVQDKCRSCVKDRQRVQGLNVSF